MTEARPETARLSSAELDRIARLIREGSPYEGYPALSDRLHLDTPGLRIHGSMLTVPHGPWHVADHPNRRSHGSDQLDPDVPSPHHPALNANLQARWHAAGLTLDQHGRPVHPDWRQLLAHPRIGLPTGIGYFYRYGPNTTVDAAIYRRPTPGALELLLIRRRAGRQWALPGGFTDPADRTPHDTARREAAEETGLRDIGGRAQTIAHNRPVGPAATLNAWTENTVVLLHGDPAHLADTDPAPGDDAIDAAWLTPDRITGLDLYDMHAQHIDTVLRHLPHRNTNPERTGPMGRRTNITVTGSGNNIATGPDSSRTITTSGGNTVTTSGDEDTIAVVNGTVYVNGRRA